MKCPKCKLEMEEVKYKSIEIDRCTNCHGMWFDTLEAVRLKSMRGSETIDIGDSKLGKKYNETDNLICPRCFAEMTTAVVDNQPHIKYEYCEVCCGLFFDAGEFRDYKKESLLDLVKHLCRRQPKKRKKAKKV